MISTEDLSQLIATLYAAPLEPAKWQVFFDHLSRLTKTSVGSLMTIGEHTPPTPLAAGGFAVNPELLRLYGETYACMDPFATPALRSPTAAIIRGETMVSSACLLKTEIYNDLFRKNEMESMTLLSLISSETESDFMPLWRRAQDGPMDEDSIALLETLLPHAQTALKIRRKLLAAGVECHFAELALEAMSMAAFLVSAGGRVLHMNSLAAAIVARADGLRLERGSLTARRPAETAQLRSIIGGAASRGRAGTQAEPPGALNISRQGAQRSFQVAILPTPEKSRRSIRIPCALVFVSDPDVAPRSRSSTLRSLYALTPAESRLADLLLQGLDLSEAAERMGTTLETTRFQLKRVQAKTGARRQSELMRLMLLLPGQ